MQQLAFSLDGRSAQHPGLPFAVEDRLSHPEKTFESRLKVIGEVDAIKRSFQPVISLLLIDLSFAQVAFGRKNSFSYSQYLLTPRRTAKGELSAVRANKTINDSLGRVRGFYSRAIKEGWYSRANPFKEFSRLPEQEALPKFLNHEQRVKLMDIAQEQGRDVYLFCALCLYAGLRTGEAINARWTWIDFDQGNIIVQGSATFRTKSKRVRSVPLHKTLRPILELYREADGYIINPAKTDQG